MLRARIDADEWCAGTSGARLDANVDLLDDFMSASLLKVLSVLSQTLGASGAAPCT